MSEADGAGRSRERLIASVRALDHDGAPRLAFRVHETAGGFVAERVDAPGTAAERVTRRPCANARELYAFFGNEPLANYLYGRLGAPVPGLRTESVNAREDAHPSRSSDGLSNTDEE